MKSQGLSESTGTTQVRVESVVQGPHQEGWGMKSRDHTREGGNGVQGSHQGGWEWSPGITPGRVGNEVQGSHQGGWEWSPGITPGRVGMESRDHTREGGNGVLQGHSSLGWDQIW